MRWFQANGRDFPWRRPGLDLYTHAVTEVLVQRTRADVVARHLPGFLSEFPNWESLADAPDHALEDALRPIGLHRRRARALRALAAHRLATDRFPSHRADLERFPGVGQYVASAILLFEYGLPEPLLDSNMARMLERFERPRTNADIRTDPFLQEASRVLVGAADPVIVNWATLDLGALVCKPRVPDCPACPLLEKCNWAAEHAPTGSDDEATA